MRREAECLLCEKESKDKEVKTEKKTGKTSGMHKVHTFPFFEPFRIYKQKHVNSKQQGCRVAAQEKTAGACATEAIALEELVCRFS